MNKKILFGSVAGAVVLAGGIGAFTLIKSPKEAYFHAEYKTAKSAIEQLEGRFEQDIKWGEIVKEDPTKQNIQLSANVDADVSKFGDDSGYIDIILEAINSSSIDLSVQSNPKENTYAVSAGAKILDVNIDPFTAYITDEKIIGEVPFQEEALELNIEKLYELSGVNPESACLPNEKYTRLIQQKELITDDDIKHIQKEILPEIYKALPDEAFDKDGKKITMKLTGKDIEDVLEVVGEVIEKDKVVKRVIEDTVAASGDCGYESADQVLKDMVNEFKNPNIDPSISIKSVITVDGSQITKRAIYLGDKLVLEGTQNFKDRIVFNYNLKDIEPDVEGTLEGEIGTGEDIFDVVTVSVDGENVLTYEGEETNSKKGLEFARELTFNDGYNKVSINWEGTSTFTGDGKISDNEIYAEVPDFGKVNLNIKTDSQKIKGIELPAKTVDLTAMSESELEQYYEDELSGNFAKWSQDLIFGLSKLFYGFN